VSQPPRFHEAEVSVPVEDDVIQQSDAHQDSSIFMLLCYFNVGRRRFKAAGRMLVASEIWV